LEKNNELPLGWTEIEFKKIVQNIPLTGKKLKQKEYLEKGKLPVIDQGQDFIGGYTDKIELKPDYNLPVIVFGDHTKITKFVDHDFIAGADGVKVLEPKNPLNPKLIFYFIQAISLPNKGYARHYQYLEKSKMNIPPLNEQKKIVEKLEEIFSKTDQIKLFLENLKLRLKQCNESLLKSSFEGNQTTNWRENNNKIQTNEVLIKKIIECRKNKSKLKFDIITPSDLSHCQNIPKSWAYVYLDSLLVNANYGTSEKCFVEKNDVPVIRIPNILSGQVNFFNLKYTKLKKSILEKLILETDDLLICRTNGSLDLVGRSAIVEKIDEGYAFASYLIRLRVENEIINSKYLNFLINSNIIRSFITEKARSTAGQFNVNLDILRSMIVPICTMTEQKKIVSELEHGFSQINNMESIIDLILLRLDQFCLMIIKQAFEGKLVPQDPNDEHASELLKRIKNH
jgi:type I restriction enzyme, S subunit